MKKLGILFLSMNLLLGTAYAQSLSITWSDNSNNEEGFLVERTMSEGCAGGWEIITYNGVNQTSLLDVRFPGACYRVAAFNQQGMSAYSNIAQLPHTSELSPSSPVSQPPVSDP